MNDINPEILTVLNLLADDKETILYRKRLNQLTDSVTATILLQQIIYWSKVNKFRPFFKFRGPCSHPWYKEGDSWTEELGFSLSEFDTAIKKIGTKITKGDSKTEAYQGVTVQHMVIYWTDSSRVSWYHLNANLLGKLVISIYLENQESATTNKNEKPDLPSTETTTETTTDIQEGASVPTPSPHDPAYLPDADTQMGILFAGQGAGVADPSQDLEAYMQTADEFIGIYRKRTGLWPDSHVQKPAIKQLAENGVDLDLWDRVVTAWVGNGWNKRNVNGMIDYYKRGEIPTTGKEGKHGTARSGNDSTLTDQHRQHAARFGGNA